jgi:hypothetical protein
VAQTKHQLQLEKFNLESHFEDVFIGMIPADEDKSLYARNYLPATQHHIQEGLNI